MNNGASRLPYQIFLITTFLQIIFFIFLVYSKIGNWKSESRELFEMKISRLHGFAHNVGTQIWSLSNLMDIFEVEKLHSIERGDTGSIELPEQLLRIDEEQLLKKQVDLLRRMNLLSQNLGSLQTALNAEFQRQKRELYLGQKELQLVFGITTIARRDPHSGKPQNYLRITCESLLKEILKYESRFSVSSSLPTFQDRQLLKAKIVVVVQNSDPKLGHEVFEELKTDPRFSGHFLFLHPNNRFEDPYKDLPGHDYLHPMNTIPGHNARQQSCDVIALQEYVLKYHPFDYFIWIEDDMESCDDSILAMVSSLGVLLRKHHKMTRNSDSNKVDIVAGAGAAAAAATIVSDDGKPDDGFCGLSMSYGMNGILVPRRRLRHFTEYAKKNLEQLPLDNLFIHFAVEQPSPADSNNNNNGTNSLFCFPNGYPMYRYRKVMFQHIGEISTFAERNKPRFRNKFPRCNTPTIDFDSNCRSNPELLSPCR